MAKAWLRVLDAKGVRCGARELYRAPRKRFWEEIPTSHDSVWLPGWCLLGDAREDEQDTALRGQAASHRKEGINARTSWAALGRGEGEGDARAAAWEASFLFFSYFQFLFCFVLFSFFFKAFFKKDFEDN